LEANYLLPALRNPECLLSLQQYEWGQLIRQARWAGLLARLHAIAEDRELLSEIPDRARDHLTAARAAADKSGAGFALGG